MRFAILTLMTDLPKNLPDDIAICHQMIADLFAEQQKKELMIDKLQHQVEQLLRARYGQRADRIDPAQLLLFAQELLETGSVAALEETPEEPETTTPRRKRKGHGRNPLPESLPRTRVEHDLSPEEKVCGHCGEDLTRIGEEISEQLEYVPASLIVIEHARLKYACKECEETVALADKPSQPIEKGRAGPGLLAHTIVSKYADHLPLARQEGILRRHGVDISRKTTCGWMMACADLLRPLYDRMKNEILSSKVIHTDDTTTPVRDPDRTKTRTGRVWTYIGDVDHPYTVFDYTPTRKRDGPMEFLAGYQGYLQADAYAGYDAIYAPGDVIEVACWAHTRRKFIEAQKSDTKRAAIAVAYIKKLYAVESEAKELDAQKRCALRRERSAPLLADLGVWLKEEQQRVLPKSPIGQAIGYALNNWEALNRYVEHGFLNIDNNTAERALRSIAVGRKNWMFYGSDRGGRAASVLCSFTATCKSLDIDPFAYLRDILTRIADHPYKHIDELLPDKWRKAKQTEESAESTESE